MRSHNVLTYVCVMYAVTSNSLKHNHFNWQYADQLKPSPLLHIKKAYAHLDAFDYIGCS